jgi:hypothetical protein
MNTMNWKIKLSSVLLTLLIACVQPPAPSAGEFEVSDENGNTVTTQAVPTNGLKGEYFDNTDFTGTTKLRYDATVNRNPGTAAPISGIQPTTYSVRWTGQIMPAFNETYTFTVTYSDGARLMVNGQVLVNDWVDGAKRTKTGAIALQANTKYDIRVESYRNATNPGTIKLEWQSKSRTKQVVPQANLFTTGMDVEAALARIVATGKIPGTANLKAINAWALKSTSGITLNVRDPSAPATYIALMTSAEVVLLYKFSNVGGSLVLDDLLAGKTSDLGPISQFANADGTVDSSAQREALARRLVGILSNGNVSASVQAQPQGGVRPQFVTWMCNVQTLPPPACVNCIDIAQTYRETVCGYAGALASTVLSTGGAVVGSLLPGVGTVVIGAIGYAIGGADPFDVLSLPFALKNIADAWNRYLECLAGKIGTNPGCPVLIEGPTPSAIEITARVSTTGSRDVSYRNSTTSTGSLDYGNQVFTFNRPSGAGFGLNGSAGGGTSALAPGQSLSLKIDYICPSAPGVITGTLRITHNARNVGSPLEVPLTLKCIEVGGLLASLGEPGNPDVGGWGCINRGLQSCTAIFVHSEIRVDPLPSWWNPQYGGPGTNGWFNFTFPSGDAVAQGKAYIDRLALEQGISTTPWVICPPEMREPWGKPTHCLYRPAP